MRKMVWFCLIGLLLPEGSAAQTFREAIVARANELSDLKFPAEAKTLSFFSPLSMAIYKPEGAGPFAALVVWHPCGGLHPKTRDWTKEALAQKYVVFIIDSLDQRGVRDNCPPSIRVHVWRQAKDAFQALDHLKRFEFVDQDRIAFMGFSQGATVGLLVSSKTVAEAFSPSKRFAAVTSFYPDCYFAGEGKFRATEWLRPDVDRPLLALMGELDTVAPPSDCLPRLEALKQRDAPVGWHLYPKAPHAWDRTPGYEDVTRDSGRRAFEFLADRLGPQR